jgi:hypothetical protein
VGIYSAYPESRGRSGAEVCMPGLSGTKVGGGTDAELAEPLSAADGTL